MKRSGKHPTESKGPLTRLRSKKLQGSQKEKLKENTADNMAGEEDLPNQQEGNDEIVLDPTVLNDIQQKLNKLTDKLETKTTIQKMMPNEHGLVPEKFTGEFYSNANTFMSRFKEYAEYRNAANKDILKLFPMMLNKRAYEWYQSQSEDIKRDWNALESAFNEKYGPTSKSFVEQTLLLDKTQGTSESVREYAAEMAKRFALAGTSEVESRKIFMTGLKTELKPYVISKTPTSWSEAEKVAIEAEQIFTMQEDAIKATCAKMIKMENSEDRTTAAAIRQLEEKMELCFVTSDNNNADKNWERRQKEKIQQEEGDYRGRSQFRERDQNYRRQWRQQDMSGPSARTTEGRPKCQICKRIGHYTGSCKAHIICYECGIKGHMSFECRRNQMQGQQWSQQHRQPRMNYNGPDHHQRKPNYGQRYTQQRGNFNA